jgi:CDP-diacylglycerol--glycerol-3-phosphate 3-phosphatidyltransferase
VNSANRISIFRILLVPFFVASLLYYNPDREALRFVALGIFLLGTLSDGVDGYIARMRQQKTRLGTFLDPLADKFLNLSAYICLSVIDTLPAELRLPLWVPLIVVSRDVLILLGASLIYVLGGRLEIRPTALGKVTTFLQMITIVSLLLGWVFSKLILGLAVGFTIISGIDYLRKGTKLLNSTQNAHINPVRKE